MITFSSAGDPLPDLPAVAVHVSDSEEEVDFGFWEKASNPASSKELLTSSDKTRHTQRQPDMREADLGLL